MSTTGSKDTTSVKGTTTTTTTATTAVKATTDVNGTSGRQGATGSVSGNDETPAPSSCAKVMVLNAYKTAKKENSPCVSLCILCIPVYPCVSLRIHTHSHAHAIFPFSAKREK